MTSAPIDPVKVPARLPSQPAASGAAIDPAPARPIRHKSPRPLSDADAQRQQQQ